MIDAIRKIMSGEDCYKNRLNCIDYGTCMNCESEQLSKLIVKHDSELLDKVAEKLKAKYPPYFNEFGMSVNDTLHKDIDEVIAELKEEVE